MKTTPLQRLEKNLTEDENGCWIPGFGQSGADKHTRFKIGRRKVRAHRYMYEQKVGPIGDNQRLYHTCDNQKCCNPDHLILKDIKSKEEREAEKPSGGRLTPAIERLRNSVTVNENGCWISNLGTKMESAYSRVSGKGQRMVGHRLMYETVNGPIPDGLFVCHKCDTPKCVNPDHLFLGTHKDNMRDMHAKGRARGGRKSIDKDEVVTTYKAIIDSSVNKLAEELGLHYSTVNKVLQEAGLREKGHKWGATEAKVLELLAEDPERSDASIAEELNITARTVAKKRLKNGIKRPVQEKKPKPVKVPQKRLPRDKICAIAAADPSKTARTIADEVGCNYYSVLDVLNKAGLRDSPPRIPSAILNKVCEIVKADPARTNASIAKELGISEKAVENKLSRRGNTREELAMRAA